MISTMGLHPPRPPFYSGVVLSPDDGDAQHQRMPYRCQTEEEEEEEKDVHVTERWVCESTIVKRHDLHYGAPSPAPTVLLWGCSFPR